MTRHLTIAFCAWMLVGCATTPGGSVAPGMVPPPPYESYGTCASEEQGRVPSLGEVLPLDFPPEALETAPPIYPPEAIEAGIEGTVVLDVLVCNRGGIGDVRVRTSIPALDPYAIDCVRRWYWRPASMSGIPVAAWAVVPVVFELPR